MEWTSITPKEFTTRIEDYSDKLLSEILERAGKKSKNPLCDLEIAVWALDPSKHSGCVDILNTPLSREEFEALPLNKIYISFKGHVSTLNSLSIF